MLGFEIWFKDLSLIKPYWALWEASLFSLFRRFKAEGRAMLQLANFPKGPSTRYVPNSIQGTVLGTRSLKLEQEA